MRNSILQMDFDQLELRVIAGMSGGSTMRHVFASGLSVHAHTASVLFDLPVESIVKDSKEYLDGKRATFAITYGATENKLIETGLATDYDEAHHVRQQLYLAYPDELGWIEDERARIRRERRSVTMLGRTRTAGDYTPIDAVERELFNHIIQGTGVELVFLAMIDGQPTVRQYNALLINQVHDEVVFEAITDIVYELRDVLVPIYEAVPFSCPLKVTSKIGPCWSV